MSISVAFAPGRRPSTEEALKRLLQAVSTYWSQADAEVIGATLRRKDYTTRTLENGQFELEAPEPQGSGMLGGFSILISDSGISVSWQSG